MPTIIFVENNKTAHCGRWKGNIMKYDLKCLRQIMLLIEENLEISMTQERFFVDYKYLSMKMEGVSTPEILHHLDILHNSGFINASVLYADDSVDEYIITGITPKGYDFLDEIRDDTVWAKFLKFADKHKGAALNLLIEKFIPLV